MFSAPEIDVLRIYPGVNVTLSHPHVHVLPASHATNVCSKKHVREKENLRIRRDRVYDLDRVSRRAAVIAFGFYVRCRIHIGNNHCARMLRLPRSQLVAIDSRSE